MLFLWRKRPLHPEGAALTSRMSFTLFGPIIPAFVVPKRLFPIYLDIPVVFVFIGD